VGTQTLAWHYLPDCVDGWRQCYAEAWRDGCTVAARVLGIFSWQSVAGLALFGTAGLIYAFVLRAVPLHVGQAFTAFQYVAVVVAASFLLWEPIPLTLVDRHNLHRRWHSAGGSRHPHLMVPGDGAPLLDSSGTAWRSRGSANPTGPVIGSDGRGDQRRPGIKMVYESYNSSWRRRLRRRDRPPAFGERHILNLVDLTRNQAPVMPPKE
jgi:hypothetical protein